MKLVSGDLKALLTLSERAAKKRSRQPSTGFLLLALLQNDEHISHHLIRHGVSESRLLFILKSMEEESTRALDRICERAQKIAAQQQVKNFHLLAALCRDTRTQAYKSLVELDVDPRVVLEEVSGAFPFMVENVSTQTNSAHAVDVQHRAQTLYAQQSLSEKDVSRFFEETDFHLVGTAPRVPITPKSNASKDHVSKKKSPNDASVTQKKDWSDNTQPRRRREDRLQNESAAPSFKLRSNPSKKQVFVQQKLDLVSSSETLREDQALSTFELNPQHFPLLTSLGRNLSLLASQGKLDDVGGREAELEQLLDVLAKRRSNNPLLIGPPGVGKTTLVEGLAHALVHQAEGTQGLQNHVIVEISAGSLVSGTAVRGALAEKIRALKEEVQKAEQKVVLFMDEIHALLGDAVGPDDMVQELKSSLARGELPCIGATTDAEYRKYVEKDPAFVRRFSLIQLEEPSEEAAIEILTQTISRYEIHHGLAFHPEAIRSAVKLSVRFLPDQFLPDKAIGLLDHAAARVSRRGGEVVDQKAIAEVVSEVAKVPLDLIVLNEKERFLTLGEKLAKKIVGHQEILEEVTKSLQKSAIGFQNTRPLGSFLFLGPSGVGKTETAKTIAEALFPKGSFLRLDMSEFSEAHSVAKLLGAPPGYIGHDEGGQLTEPVRRQPYQLILLDELEKAHREVLLALLPALDEGRLTDSRGRVVDYSNTVIVMTSNLGADCVVTREKSIGFGSDTASGGVRFVAARQNALDTAKQFLPVEFWNRIDAVHWFSPLLEKDIARILLLRLQEFSAQLFQDKQIHCVVQPSAVQILVELGEVDLQLGARPIQRLISRWVESPVASMILHGKLKGGDKLEIQGKNGKIHFQTDSSLNPAMVAG